MTRTYVFLSYELAPVNAGGCGVFIQNALQELLEDDNNRIMLILDMPKHECEKYEKLHQPSLPNSKNLSLYCLSELLHDDPNCGEQYNNIFLQKSYRFYIGLRKLTYLKTIDYAEFFDYVGIGYFSFRAKKFEGEFLNTILSVRAHCTIDLMDMEQVPNEFSINKLEMYQMEKKSIQSADYVLVPSSEWGNLYVQRYGVDQDKVIVSPPPVKKWEEVKYILNETQQDVLFYGRIFQLKGVDVYVDSAVSFMSKYPNNKSIFYLVGYDGLDSLGQPYSSQLLTRIPEHLRNRFIFTGQINRTELQKLLQSIRFAIFPNLVESFCYSIHELYSLGVPIIANQIPAFNDYFRNEENALTYNGTSIELISQMEKLFTNSNLRKQISSPYAFFQNNLFEISYKNMLKTKKEDISHNKPWKCSLVVLQEEQSINKNLMLLLEHSEIEYEKSYLLTLEPPGTPILFLGKTRYAKRFDGSVDHELVLESFVLTCYSDDIIESSYIDRVKHIFSIQPELYFVGCRYKNDQNSPEFDLYEENMYFACNKLTRSIIRIDEKSSNLRNVYKTSLGALGEWGLLNNSYGYTIPEEFINLGKSVLEIKNEYYIYNLHRSTASGEWNPYILYPFAYQLSMDKSRNEIKKTKRSKMRTYYYKLKHKVDGMSGFKGKLAVVMLRKISSVVKKWSIFLQ
ncbi:Glycosyltransferase involved in cell wall bisynthesis [Paenibacillus sp. yr247]|uniref:glycosyltransferase family 4 protein n=1 Tax=Paenibacillus sp. yr247 TaxID=1761880 RepID=UPI0008816F68|nr:glycosyltransferase family 4 protein [Paenibacillus sp. yr247]SDN35132.1 Glycosyltransferase involved in cell wall bisynthesis [Paenibacillus sp. yr247]